MRKTKLIKAATFGFFLLLSAVAFGQTQKKFLLYIEDNDKKPVDLVDIEITNLLNGEVIFNSTVYTFPESFMVNAGSYSITARKYGYTEEIDTVEINSSEIFHKMTMVSNLQKIKIGTSGIAKPSILIPGIVNIISREQIEQYGFRDITELLRNQAGIEFAHDVFGNIGIAVRGVWGIEGKVLLLFNGIQMNEMNYGSVSWLQRIPLENVERIEITRGPVSVINNGGLASYGTINIVTRSSSEGQGLKVGAIYGINQSDATDVTRQQNSLLFNRKFGEDFSLDISAYNSHGHVSTDQFTDFSGYTKSLAEETQYNVKQLYMSAAFKTTRLKVLIDDYKVQQPIGFGALLNRAYEVRYPNAWIDLTSEVALSKKLTYIPRFVYSKQKPYSSISKLDSIDNAYFGGDDPYDDINSTKFGINNRLNFKPSQSVNMDFLFEYTQDNFSRENSLFDGLNSYFFNFVNLVYGFTSDFYLLGAKKLNSKKALNLNLAARYDNQTFFNAFTPQAGLTLLNNKLYSKVLVARSFKAPLLSNVIYNAANSSDLKPNIKPEFTNSYELEVGFTPTIKTSFSVIGYIMRTAQTITYGPGINIPDNYFNSGNSGTSGVDFNSIIGLGNAAKLLLNASYYLPNSNDTNFKTIGFNTNLGISQTKVSANLSLDLNKMLKIKRTNLTLGYIYNSAKSNVIDSVYTIGMIPATNIINLNFTITNINEKGLDFSFGVYDLLNQRYDLPQPYYGGMATIKGLGREFLFRIAYSIGKD